MFSACQEHNNRHSDNNYITDNAQKIGNLPEHEKAERGGKDNLRIIIDRNIARGSINIRRRDCELTAGRGKPRKKQKNKL